MSNPLEYDYSTLNWVKGQIDERLKQVRFKLEEAESASVPETGLNEARDYLHEVRGSLRMVELYGAAMVAEEMESVVLAIANGSAVDRDAAYAAVLQGLVQLPDYLDRLQSGFRDVPTVLLPLLNALRTARGASAVTETVLFSPKLSTPLPDVVRGSEQPLKLSQQRKAAGKLRLAFQTALLNFLRSDDNRDVHVKQMLKVLLKIREISHQPPVWRMAWAAEGMLEAILVDGLDADQHVKAVLGRLDRELKRFAEGGDPAFRRQPPEELTRALLYYVAVSTATSPRVTALRDTYHLAALLPRPEELAHAEGAMAGRNRELMSTVAAAIREDLDRIKDTLDVFLGDPDADASALEPLSQKLDSVADTLGMLGLSKPRRRVLDQAEVLSEVVSGVREADETVLIDVAGNLLLVEASLDDHLQFMGGEAAEAQEEAVPDSKQPVTPPAAEMRKVVVTVMSEALVNVARAKQTLVEFFDHPRQRDAVAAIPDSVREIAGALAVVQMDFLADGCHRVADFVGQLIAAEPRQEAFDRLAEVIAAIEMYMEAVRDEHPGRQRLTESIRHCLDRLEKVDLTPVSATGTTAEEAVPAVKQEVAAETPVATVQPGIEYAEDIDDEIREVFVEEVEEELGKIRQLYPAWKADNDDAESLATLRRCFHTLKGSGRLVGARIIGEFAWSVENLLNRIIDHTLVVEDGVFALLDDAVVALDQLYGQIASGAPIEADISSIQTRAFALADGTVAGGAEARESVVLPTAAEAVAEGDEAVADATETASDVDEEAVQEITQEAAAPLASENDIAEGEGSPVGIEAGDQPLVVDEDDQPAVDALLDVESAVEDTGLDLSIESDQQEQDRITDEQDTSDPGPDESRESDEPDLELSFDLGTGEESDDEDVLTFALEDQEADEEGIVPPDLEFELDIMSDAMDTDLEAGPGDDDQIDEAESAADEQPPVEIDFELEIESELQAPPSESTAETPTTTDRAEEADLETLLKGWDDAEMGMEGEPGSGTAEVEPDSEGDFDPVLLEIFEKEARGHLQTLLEYISSSRESGAPVLIPEDALRAVHTVHGAACMAEIPAISTVSEALEHYFRILAVAPEAPGEVGFKCIEDVAAFFTTVLDRLVEKHEIIGVDSELLGRCRALADEMTASGETLATHPLLLDEGAADIAIIVDDETEGATETDDQSTLVESVAGEAEEETPELAAGAETDPELLQIFLDEGSEILARVDEHIQQLRGEDDQDVEAIAALQRELHTLKGSARMAAVAPVGDLAHDLESLLERAAVEPLRVDSKLISASEQVLDFLQDCLNALRTEKPMPAGDALHDLLASLQAEVPVAGPEPAAGLAAARVGTTADEMAFTAQIEIDDSADAVFELGDDVDSELLDVYIQEGTDILDTTDGLIERLRDSGGADREVLEDIQRELHTLKGGARMAGIDPMGGLAHRLESLLEEITSGRRQPDRGLLDLIVRCLDTLHGQLMALRTGTSLRDGQALADYIDNVLAQVPEAPAPETEAQTGTVDEGGHAEPSEEVTLAGENEAAEKSTSEPAPGTTGPAGGEAEFGPVSSIAAMGGNVIPLTRPMSPMRRSRARRGGPETSEVVRVRAPLLDNLVNYAGEVSIYRGRLEQQIGNVRFNLEEFERTVTRLRDQLRKLEIETEAQILSRYQREAEQVSAEFDPLELDRFSQLQLLSRSLTESLSDLVSIQDLLDDQTRESETLLLQQSRVTSELQEGLMRTRMVPFSNVVPRLRRIVRQTTAELGKRANLSVRGAEGEMDRTVLERITPALEHLLRNALDHGLEDSESRLAADKPEEGEITIEVSRQASEVVIVIRDDGQGIDLQRVRNRAIERGLMAEGAELPDVEVIRFIVEAGFSTAETVTQLSGRGVGMDVVNSEIQQLNGTLDIASEAGVGTTFSIRLPFTLLVSQAIVIKLADENFAIPLSGIEAIYRMPRDEFEARVESGETQVSYGGDSYPMHDLGLLLGRDSMEAVEEDHVPLLMTRSGDLRAAVRVTELLGNKEIVIKSTGAQMSSIPGVSGATVLGDGSVILILDLIPLVRRAAALQVAPMVAEVAPSSDEADRQARIMVVDDSITMRKVASRMLERHDYHVQTAKDGVEAVSLLHDSVPDLMLLDIEMPRMDGYELATHMRNSSNLKQIPIIMITSRTGQKHRQRAFDIGVDRYLGKPYQESELLATIQELLGGASAASGQA